ncbi:hypothetical protein F5148DRAFT_1280824 [Russula earlei]|uniref:Uncharacterized protein n=1 Tax=Russula earlei TaxID=71964 RepID=A0ACC0UI67_9AGAM|nr:hypothetical protein F5148DRAFT_1280824 [Russula earlei]
MPLSLVHDEDDGSDHASEPPLLAGDIIVWVSHQGNLLVMVDPERRQLSIWRYASALPWPLAPLSDPLPPPTPSNSTVLSFSPPTATPPHPPEEVHEEHPEEHPANRSTPPPQRNNCRHQKFVNAQDSPCNLSSHLPPTRVPLSTQHATFCLTSPPTRAPLSMHAIVHAHHCPCAPLSPQWEKTTMPRPTRTTCNPGSPPTTCSITNASTLPPFKLTPQRYEADATATSATQHQQQQRLAIPPRTTTQHPFHMITQIHQVINPADYEEMCVNLQLAVLALFPPAQ